jgi:IS30 family transposase
VERLSALELERIEELLSEDAPFWRLRQEVPRSRYAIYRAVKRLRRPPAPGPNRSPLRLSLAEREEISRGVAAGESLRVIACRLGRTPSTVSREVARNGGRAGYRACRADREGDLLCGQGPGVIATLVEAVAAVTAVVAAAITDSS